MSNFEGHRNHERHRTVGEHRAWCECGQWCCRTFDMACSCCAEEFRQERPCPACRGRGWLAGSNLTRLVVDQVWLEEARAGGEIDEEQYQAWRTP